MPIFQKGPRFGRKKKPEKKKRGCPAPIFLLALICLTGPASDAAPLRVIIDTDPGVDDAMAILLALNSPELKVEALTVVPGNVEAAQGLENALKIVSLAGRCDATLPPRRPPPPPPNPTHHP